MEDDLYISGLSIEMGFWGFLFGETGCSSLHDYIFMKENMVGASKNSYLSCTKLNAHILKWPDI